MNKEKIIGTIIGAVLAGIVCAFMDKAFDKMITAKMINGFIRH